MYPNQLTRFLLQLERRRSEERWEADSALIEHLMSLALLPFTNQQIPSGIMHMGAEGFTKHTMTIPGLTDQLSASANRQLISSFRNSLTVYPGLCEIRNKKTVTYDEEQVHIARNTLHNLMVLTDAVIALADETVSVRSPQVVSARELTWLQDTVPTSPGKTLELCDSEVQFLCQQTNR